MFPDSSVGKESAYNAGDPSSFLGQEDPLERDELPTPKFLGFPCGSVGKESTCNVGDLGLIPGLGRSPGEGKYMEKWVYWNTHSSILTWRISWTV